MSRCHPRPLALLGLIACALASVPAAAETPTQASGLTPAPSPHRPRRNLAPSPIQLVLPDASVALLSQVPATIQLHYTYTGGSRLVFSLVDGAAGMTVAPESGRLAWTPPLSAEGSEVGVRIRASDGASAAEVEFTLRVAATQTIATSLAGQTLTVTQPGTLQGLALTFPAQTSLPPTQLSVATLPPGQAPALPDGVTRLSDFFRVTPVSGSDGPITVTMPVGALPAKRSPQELRLFVYSDAAQDVGEGDEGGGPFWIRTWCGLDVLPGGKVVIQLQALGELSFIGLDAPGPVPAVPAGPAVGHITVGSLDVTTTCVPFVLGIGFPDLTRSVCLVGYAPGKSFTVVVKSFADFHPSPTASLSELLGWLAAGRTAFDGYGLQSDPVFEVVVEPMPEPTWYGFVTTGSLENRRVLHLTNAAKARDALKGTAVHEYFHHAQSRTTSPGKTNLIDTRHLGDWLIEGLARWVEDDIFDTLNTYKLMEASPFTRILFQSVAAIPDENNRAARAYARWAFWKMVSLKCSGFSIPDILNVDAAADPTGIVNFKQKVESPGWQCDFGAGFGDANRATLADALLYYSYATDKENNLALLDANEPYAPFARPGDRLIPSTDCTSWDACPHGSMATTFVNDAAADAYVIDAMPSLSPGQTVAISVESVPAGRELWLWAGDNEKPGGLTSGAWYKKTSTIVHSYADGTRAPETMVFVVNPDPTQTIHYRIRASLVSTLLVWSVAPIFSPGSTGADMTLTAYNALPWPASYKLVWSFGDGGPEVTVTGATTVVHRWPAVGDYAVIAKLYSLPDNTLRAQAQATARIRAFHGDFRLSQFTGSHSGCFWHTDFPETYDKIAADPAATELYLSFAAPSYETPTDTYLWFDPAVGESEKLWVGADDPAMTAPDCPHVLQVVGNTLTARYANGIFGNGAAATCIEVLATQVGSHVEGTLTHRDTYYSAVVDGGWQLVCRGDAVYTFKGDWSGL